jgi:hypothetical protein
MSLIRTRRFVTCWTVHSSSFSFCGSSPDVHQATTLPDDCQSDASSASDADVPVVFPLIYLYLSVGNAVAEILLTGRFYLCTHNSKITHEHSLWVAVIFRIPTNVVTRDSIAKITDERCLRVDAILAVWILSIGICTIGDEREQEIVRFRVP